MERALAEDLEPLGDITSVLVPDGSRTTGVVVARVPGVLAGRAAAAATFLRVDPIIEVVWSGDDGIPLVAGSIVARVQGPLASILTAERTALNFLCHLSGVATLTRRFVDAAAGGGRARIRDTRKTTPGLRALEKAAVRAGGGVNHRASLGEEILIKDNHLAGMTITEAVARARAQWPVRTLEVEADHLEQVQEAMAVGADVVLLDNMSPEEVSRCVEARGSSTRPFLEASGGINLGNVGAYAATGVDFIAVGALTSSAPALDLGLDIPGGDIRVGDGEPRSDEGDRNAAGA